MNSKASTELQAQDLEQDIKDLLNQANPNPQDLVASMLLAFEMAHALSQIGAMSHGRRIAVNGLIASLMKLHLELANRLTAILQNLMLSQPIPSTQLPGGGASVFKP